MFTKEQAYAKIADLVERFSFQIEDYKRNDYNEAQTRQDYINPPAMVPVPGTTKEALRYS